MSNCAVITFAPFELERDYFFVFPLLDYFGSDFGAGNERVAMCQLFSIGIHEYVAKCCGFTGIDIQ